jgi:hypothetical protein
MIMIIPKDSPAADEALRRTNEIGGFDITEVLLDHQWAVDLDGDGHAEIMVNDAGLRALALMSPRADAQEFVESAIAGRPGPA